MISFIDIGNTNIVISFLDNEKMYRIKTKKDASADEYAFFLDQYFNNLEAVIISSVVPEINNAFCEYFTSRFNINPTYITPGIKTGIKIKADNPKEVGSDLICDTVGAVSTYSDTCLVIDLGTATKFIYIENKSLKGVAIAPGMETGKKSLISRTSLLLEMTLETPSSVLGSNTITAMKSGLVYGHSAMIDGMIERIKEEVGNKYLKIIITGGLAKLVEPLLKEKVIRDDYLIFRGLKSIYLLNNIQK